MSIASEITRIQGNVADAYTAANNKGATMPVTQDSDHLANTINSISTGITPTGTKNITANGTYDVTNYASADVNVPTTAPAHYIEKSVDANGVLQNGASTIIDMTGVTNVGQEVLKSAYYLNTTLTGTVNMSSLTGLSYKNSCANAFQGSHITGANLSSLTTVSGDNACLYMFYECKFLTTVNLSSLTTISSYSGCNYMFAECSNLPSINLSSLDTISGKYGCQCMFYRCVNLNNVNISTLRMITGESACSRMFTECGAITTLDLSGLQVVSSGQKTCEEMFSGCTSLTSVDISGLYEASAKSAFYNAFKDCSGLTTVSFSSLQVMTNSSTFNYTFTGCTSLSSLFFPCLTSTSFGSYTNQFNGMLSGVTGCTVHFPSNMQSVIGSWASVTGGFGGTNTTVLFDLPATNTLTGADTATYTRNPKYDTATSLAWKVGAYGTTNFTPAYYTSGTTDPAVGDTIYSDAACTVAVTTVSAVA